MTPTPTCLHCKRPCPDDPTKAFIVRWAKTPIGYACSAKCAATFAEVPDPEPAPDMPGQMVMGEEGEAC